MHECPLSVTDRAHTLIVFFCLHALMEISDHFITLFLVKKCIFIMVFIVLLYCILLSLCSHHLYFPKSVYLAKQHISMMNQSLLS